MVRVAVFSRVLPALQSASDGKPQARAIGATMPLEAGLASGKTIDVRLNVPVYSDRSRVDNARETVRNTKFWASYNPTPQPRLRLPWRP
jgi:hypothetical protein